jgi:TP901 family phage tail tape measure protein
MRAVGERLSDAGQKVAMAGGAMAAGLGFAVKTAADFEAQMSKVRALSGATEADFQRLRQAAIDLGAKSVYSASEAAEGMQILAAAGFDANQIIAAMPGLLNAAAAAGENFGAVADIMVAAMSGFGLQARDMSHIADVLASAANASAISITDIGYSLKYIAPVAKTAGVSLEEVAAALAILGNTGIKAEQAGTTLRMALIRLADPPKEAAKMMEQLGIRVTDASGKMLPFQQIIAILHEKFSGLSQAQRIQAAATIFGAEAMSGMLALIEAGPEKLGALTSEFQNSSGAAQQMADIMTDNLAGALEELKGALESALITIGTILTPAIRAATEHLRRLVEWFNKLPEPVQRFISVGAALSAVLLLVGGGIMMFVGQIMQTMATAQSLGVTLRVLPGLFTALTGPVGIAVAAVAGFAAAAYLIYKNWDGIKAFFANLWGQVRSTVVNFAGAILEFLRQWGPQILAVVAGPIGLLVIQIAKRWDEIKTGVSTAWAAIKSVAAAAVGNVVSTIRDVFAGVRNIAQDALAWGRAIVEGLWEGIKGAVGWLKNMLASWVGDVMSFVRRLLGISSPSELTREMGQQVAEGLAVGIEERKNLVLAALDAQVEAMEVKLKGAAASLEAIEAKVKEATARLEAMEEKRQRAQEERERRQLQQEVANADARVRLTEQDIALLQKKLAEYQKHKKDVSSVLQQIAEAEQRLTKAKQQAADARARLADFEAQRQEQAARRRIEAIREEEQKAREQIKRLREQQRITQDLRSVIAAYYEDMAAAQEEYEQKVAALNRQLAEDERRLWEEYNQSLERRVKLLRDFVGLFDQVNLKPVSGQQLLENLRQQVQVFKQWQENIRALAARGVDEGLLAELRKMGPRAAAEIAALNTLSDQELSEYVTLWRIKNAEAKMEAQNQLVGLLAETQAKIAELRAKAAEQLEQYRLAWQEKTEQIRQNTVEQLKKLVEEAAKHGTEMVTRLAAAITTALPQLSEALAGLPGFAPAVDSGAAKEAQKQKKQVVEAAVEQKQGVVDANAQATATVLQTWYNAGLMMAARHEEIKTQTLATWQQIQQQLSVLWAKMLADVKKTWDEMRNYLFEVTKQVEQRFAALVNAATNWGVSLMSNFIAGIWSQFDRLLKTLQAMAETVAAYMPHSPAEKGPLARLDEWGPALVREVVEGIRRGLPSLEEIMGKMAGAMAVAPVPAVAAAGAGGNVYYGGNTIIINVQGGSMREIAEELLRELARRGVRI